MGRKARQRYLKTGLVFRDGKLVPDPRKTQANVRAAVSDMMKAKFGDTKEEENGEA